MRAVIVFCVISLSLVVAWEPDSKKLNENIVDLLIYQIYPRSFKDSDGDGIGDLKGIESKLDYLVELNVDAIWLSPIFRSPMVDFGYDISNFNEIDPIFGTMRDFESLVAAAHKRSLKVILDFVPNHTSDQHEWFLQSKKNATVYRDYYVWRPGRVLENGTRVPPNNWVSVFGGPAWTWAEGQQKYYLHQFAAGQPDLNYHNQDVMWNMKDVLRFWLMKDVDGFRMDAVPFLYEDQRYLDEPLTGLTNDPNKYEYTEKIYTIDQHETYELILKWRQVMNEFPQPKYLMVEAYTSMEMTMKYYGYGVHYPFNFAMITEANEKSNAPDFKNLIDAWILNMPSKSIPNWVTGNHDKPRLATRFGQNRARMVTAISLLLPGVTVTYNGEEIGMENTYIPWEETMDPQGCNAGKEGFETASRDPARTPLQWDDSVSAGFSTNPKPWIRVNENYKTLNVAAQKVDENSYYNMYKKLALLKKAPYFKRASLTTKLLNDNVFALAREAKDHISVYAVTNFADNEETVDLSVLDNVSNQLKLYYVSPDSALLAGSVISDIRNITIPPLGIAIFITPEAEFGNDCCDFLNEEIGSSCTT